MHKRATNQDPKTTTVAACRSDSPRQSSRSLEGATRPPLEPQGYYRRQHPLSLRGPEDATPRKGTTSLAPLITVDRWSVQFEQKAVVALLRPPRWQIGVTVLSAWILKGALVTPRLP